MGPRLTFDSLLPMRVGQLEVLQPQDAAELPDEGPVEWAPLVPYWSVLWRSGVALARAVARRLGCPCRRLLERLPGPAQTGLTLAERRVAPVFCATTAPRRHVLVVDDVVTSGATLSAAARALRAAGATEVDAVAAARTPLKLAVVPADTARSD